MAEGDANNAGLGLLDDPDGRENGRLTGLRGLPRNRAKDFGAFGTGELDVVAFVTNSEGGRDARHDRVRRLGHGEREFAVSVTTGTTADELVVILGLERPVIPSSGMQEDDALPCGGEVTDGFLELRRAELGVIAAEEEKVSLREQLEGFLEVRGRGYVIASGLNQLTIGTEEELREVVRATRAGHKDPELTSFACGKLLARRRRGAGIVGRKVIVLHRGALGLTLTLGRSRRGGRSRRLRQVGSATDFSGDRHRRRSHGVTGAGQDKLLDDVIAFHRKDERADVVALHQARSKLRAGDFGVVGIIIGEVAPSHLGDDLLAATDETNLHRHGRQTADARPTTDGTQEVQARGGNPHRDLNRLREGLRISTTGTALQDDDILAVLRLCWVDDVIGYAIGGDLAELHEGQGVALGFAAGVETPASVRGHGRREVQQLERAHRDAIHGTGFATEIGDDVTQAFGTEGFKAFRHQGGLNAGAGGDIGDLHLDGHARGLLELHDHGVFAADEGGVLHAVLHLDIPGTVLVIDHAVRIDNVHEQFRGGVRTDALEIRAKLIADLTDHVTGLAGRHEELLALGDVTRLLHLGAQLGDDFVLRTIRDSVHLCEDRRGALRHRLVRVTRQLGGLQGPELHRRKGLGIEGIQHEAGPFRAGHEGRVSSLPDQGLGLQEGTHQRLTRLDVASRSQGFDRREGHHVRGAFLQELGDGRQDGGIDLSEGNEHASRRGADGRSTLLIGQLGKQLLRRCGEFGLQFVTLKPSGRQGYRRQAELRVAMGDALFQGELGIRHLLGRSGRIPGREDLQHRAGDRDIAGRGGRDQHAQTWQTIVRGGEAGRQGAHELKVGGFRRSHLRFQENRGIGGRCGRRGRLAPMIRELALRSAQQRADFSVHRGSAQGAQRR